MSVFGLGYVGAVTCAALADRGCEVVGVDIDPNKVKALSEGRAPVPEPGLGELLSVNRARISATTNPAEAVSATQVSIICVGTPSDPAGGVDLGQVASVFEVLKRVKPKGHRVMLRSTVPPGTTRRLARELGDGSVVFVPEFLREGNAIEDFGSPAYTLVGEVEPGAGEWAREFWREVLPRVPVHRVKAEIAELLKYASNVFHALKVAFANEMGSLARALGLDGKELMRLLVLDRKLNVSPAYLRPGFAFGGSCLPKDLRAISRLSRERGLRLPLVEAIFPSNRAHIERAKDLILSLAPKRVGFWGVSFKPGTGDGRESPVVELMRLIAREGVGVAFYEQGVLSLPGEVVSLSVPSPEALVEWAEVVVVSARDPRMRELLAEKRVVDLIGVPEAEAAAEYFGICW